VGGDTLGAFESAKPIWGDAGKRLILKGDRHATVPPVGSLNPILGDNEPKQSQFFAGIGLRINALECVVSGA
jgi:hypothetical protein